MNPFSIETRQEGEVAILLPRGYYSGESGEQVHQVVESLFQSGKTRFLFDFSGCDLVNSPGVVSLMDLVVKITEDFKGKAALTGLDDLKKMVFRMAGVTNFAVVAGSPAEGIQLLESDS